MKRNGKMPYLCTQRLLKEVFAVLNCIRCNKTKNRGQVSIEFMSFLGIMLFILALASYATISAGNDIREDNNAIDSRRLASMLAQEINIAVEIGDGYYHSFTLPELLSVGTNYSINFSENRFVSIEWNNRSYSLPYLAENITGTIKKGQNTIRNSKSVIFIE